MAATPPPVVSVVIPTLNEAARLPELLRRLAAEPVPHEVIVSDGGSADGTPEIAANLGARLVTGHRGRGPQLRAGASLATGGIVWLLHADSVVPPGALSALIGALAARPDAVGGNFRLLFDGDDPFSRWLDGFYARIRARGVFYGDSGIFVRRAVLEAVGGVPALELMEDHVLVRRLSRRGPMLLVAEPPLLTSSRRFAGRSPRAIVAGWALVHAMHALGFPPRLIARVYDSARRRPGPA